MSDKAKSDKAKNVRREVLGFFMSLFLSVMFFCVIVVSCALVWVGWVFVTKAFFTAFIIAFWSFVACVSYYVATK